MRGRRAAYIVLLALLVPPGASAGAGDPPAPLRDEGAVFVYLEPLAGDASRLDFRFDEFFAVREDGTRVPLALSFHEARDEAPSGQRLLATDSLAPGQYRGLAIGVANATLEGEDGPVELTPPGGPVQIEAPFAIRKRQAVVLELRFEFAGSVQEGSAFAPVFRAHPAERPAVGRLGLVSNRDTNSVTIFDKVSARVVSVIPTGRAPAGIALDQDRKRAYVAVSGEDTLIVIGLLEAAIIERTTLRGDDLPVDLALTPDGGTLLSANLSSNTVSLIDTRSFVEVERIQVGSEPRSVRVDPAGERAYVLNTASSNISVIDLRNRRLVGVIPTEAEPLRCDFNLAGDVLYVIHRLVSRLSVIDPAGLRVMNKIYVGPGATALTIDPRSDFLYVSRSGTGIVEVFDPIAFLPVDSFPVAGDVSAMAIDVEQNYLYVVLPELRRIQVTEVVGHRSRGWAETGEGPYWVVVSGER